MFPGILNTSNAVVVITVDPKVLWIGFGVVFIFAIIMSIILIYHWSNYGYKPIKTGVTGAMYFTGVFILLGVIFFSIISYLPSF